MTPVILSGPTASGKSAVAVELAVRLRGEIVSVDSMQVYRGLDIGTAKPTAEESARVRHHLVDVAGLDESFDAARFVSLATAAIGEITASGRLPILCGGTGMYFNAYLNGLGDAPPPDPTLRAELEALPTPVLLDELARRDWTTFDEIDIQNRRRVIRAVEVIRLTGKPFSSQRAQWPDRAQATVGRAFGLQRSRDDLVRRINKRVDAMFAAGLVDETRHLLDAGLRSNRTAMQAIGYRQVVEHLEGIRGLRDTIELVKVKTRQFAKRQLTWTKGQLDLQWIEAGPDESTESIAESLISRLKQ